jgi:hypothetical protein
MMMKVEHTASWTGSPPRTNILVNDGLQRISGLPEIRTLKVPQVR